MKWSEQAWKAAEPIYNRVLELPFLHELMNGSLAEDKFLFYIGQDAIYLSEYGKVLAGIASKLNKPEYKTAFLRFAGDTIAVEGILHESFLKTNDKVVPNNASPTCLLYTGFMHSQLACSPIEVALASVLPCFWVYKNVGDFIVNHQQKSQNPYQSWIDTYGGEDFALSVKEAIDICDEVASTCNPAQRAAMTDAFVLAVKMEWMFWNSAWNREQWPI